MSNSKSKGDLRAHQRVRISKLVSGSWPESGDIVTPHIEQNSALLKAVIELTHETRLAEHIPEYGPEHLDVYRDLRDHLYDFNKVDSKNEYTNGKSNGHVNGHANGHANGKVINPTDVKPKPTSLINSRTIGIVLGAAASMAVGLTVNIPLGIATSIISGFAVSKTTRGPKPNTVPAPLTSRELTTTLWNCHAARTTKLFSASTSNPFIFPDLTTNHVPAIPGDHHDAATTEQALGYDECVRRAEAIWLASDSSTDLMAILGKEISTWCTSYTNWHPGIVRRWALYGAMNDTELITRLSRLRPRHACHMKDGLLQGMNGRQVVDTVILPCTGMFSDSPSGVGYSGDKVWPASLLVCLVVWADYAGAEDAKSSAGAQAWDLLAPWVSALAAARGVAADEIKACTMTLYGAKLGLFLPDPKYGLTQMWHARGYDGGVHTSAAAIAMTRRVPYPEDKRTLDLAATVMAVHDAIDCEADVVNRTECNLVLLTVYKGIGVEVFIDTVYATFALHWAATDIYGQFPLGALQEQTSGSRWGGPVYLAESRVDRGINFWKSALSRERVDAVVKANILPTTTKLLSTMPMASSWHEVALRLSADELLASPFGKNTGAAKVQDLLAISKGTMILICACSCSECGQDPKLKFDNWVGGCGDGEYAARVMEAVGKVRSLVDGPLQTIRAWLKADPRPDAIYRITAEAFMAVGPVTRYMVALLEGLILEDALYHGADTLSYCVAWLPSGLVQEEDGI
ncbi:hypothetical protein OQA88_9959 [Cercophora sp. LCS_1]